MIRWPYNWRKKEGISMRIPHLAGAIYKWDCLVENMFIKYAKLPESGINTSDDRDDKVVISLTSYPKRINQCYYSIKSLMIQETQADRIVLWLAEEQFINHQLPKKFNELVERGLEIRYCDDLKSHKKYFYMLQEQKENEVVITFDDDIIYDYRAVSRLISAHEKYPDSIIVNRGFEMTVTNGCFDPVSTWPVCSEEGIDEPSIKIQMSTGSGCLYPYNCMPQSTFNKENMLRYAPTADDMWVTFNRIIKGIKVVKTSKTSPILCVVYGSQIEKLTQINDVEFENDRTVERLLTLFPEAMDMIDN